MATLVNIRHLVLDPMPGLIDLMAMLAGEATRAQTRWLLEDASYRNRRPSWAQINSPV